MTFKDVYEMHNGCLYGWQIIFSDGTRIFVEDFLVNLGFSDNSDFIWDALVYVDEMNCLIKFSIDE